MMENGVAAGWKFIGRNIFRPEKKGGKDEAIGDRDAGRRRFGGV